MTGSKEGRGTLEIAQTGDRYEGEFVKDQMHGQGVYYFQAKRSEAGQRVEVRYGHGSSVVAGAHVRHLPW